MGCFRSSSYPEICDAQVETFKIIMRKYCGRSEDKVGSKMAATNYKLVNIESKSNILEEAKLDPDCKIYWTDFLEILMLRIKIAVLAKVAYIK